jgi:hypothetical protein
MHNIESAFFFPALYGESREYPNSAQDFLRKLFAQPRENTVHGMHKLKDHESILKALSQMHREHLSP